MGIFAIHFKEQIMEPFTPQDIVFLEERGSNLLDVTKQFSFYSEGFPFAQLERIATINDGISTLSNSQLEFFKNYYVSQISNKQVVKFVPASGAASRMFKDLFDFLNQDHDDLNDKIKMLIQNLQDFAFFADLKPFIQQEDQSQWDPKYLISKLLLEEGLNYGDLPKGVLKFHKYHNENRTAFEEHLVEAALYANCNGICKIHFTVSPQHRSLFEDLVASVKGKYEKRFNVIYEITYSIQDPSTDTLASDVYNQPFRDKKGKLLFRPGGHGALIHNLNNINADLVFIKNIDNVITEDKLKDTIDYKQACGGLLLFLQNKNFEYIAKLKNSNISIEETSEIIEFARNHLHIQFKSSNPSIHELFNTLNRPIRVCGMVKNEGEPGGGPFWVTNHKNETSCQIVESSQIDLKNIQQKTIMLQATHFNPVDMVCSFKDFTGNPFNLKEYVDEKTGFISEKSYEGRTLKAMELPGLWNGAMADWITIFVEVPLSTFNPVKTIFDLLKR